MNLKEIKELIDLLTNSEIAELEVERAGARIRIRKAERPAGPAPPSAPGLREGTRVAPGDQTAAAGPGEVVEGVFTAKSPIVGTFYRAPSPDAEPYIELGDEVKKGQILCVVEAMKLMNEIESEVDGKVIEVLVENGHPVEYGEPLFRIQTA